MFLVYFRLLWPLEPALPAVLLQVDPAGCAQRPMRVRQSVLQFVLETLREGEFPWQVARGFPRFR